MAVEKNDLLLDIRGLQVVYETDEDTVYAVNSLDLSLRQGESLGLVGETGAGKTTTALSVLRLVADPPGKIVEGEIFFDGVDLLKVDKKAIKQYRGSRISMIFQDPMTSLNPVHTIGDQIAEVIRTHDGCDKGQAREKAVKVLETVGISRDRYDEYPHQFSGGMKQRVVIAMSIACSPQLILADEPTTALDVTIQAQVLELMNELKEELKTSVLLITHDLGVVAQVCDRVAIMYAGKIVESGEIASVFDDPQHPYTIGLFASIPTLDQNVDKLKPIKGQMPDPASMPAGCAFHPRCPYAQDVCSQREPVDTQLQGDHKVCCLIAEGLVDRVVSREDMA